MSYAKAQIVPLNAEGKSDGAKPIECMFNPREYTITREVKWETQSNDTNDAGDKVYKGGSAAQLNLELFFDTYGNRKGGSSQVEDVRKYTERLWALTRMEEKNQSSQANKSVKKPIPAKVLFQWGGTWHFAAIIRSIEQQFMLFMPDGTPVRSVIKITLEQADTETHFYGRDAMGNSLGPRDASVGNNKSGQNNDLRRMAKGNA
ncbi:hypothetical protein Dxin01_02855 [Deinococcus xinjiangensis]|uniref:Contractile injection system tube protein N-terminal domain-containing protein n=1 Tax=Deinococcus xinjiangensis TaxID=457454 RepID=A0ABP9VEQ6_9DEIO